MKAVFILSFAVLCGLNAVWSEETYTNKFDDVDMEAILNNDRLLKKYGDCLLDHGKCSPDGAELKRVIPDALATRCAKCNDKQKKEIEKALRFLIVKKPGLYKQLEDKYDPRGTYRKEYEAQKKLIQEGKPITKSG